jgi:fumarate hydratase class II
MADVRREHDSLGEIEVPADRLRRADPALAREFPDRPRPLRLAAAGDPRLRDPEEGGSTRQRHARATRSGGGTIRAALDGLYELPLGGTAVGIGLNAPARFGSLAAELIAVETGHPFRQAANLFAVGSAHDAMVTASAALHTTAGAPMKIAMTYVCMRAGRAPASAS